MRALRRRVRWLWLAAVLGLCAGAARAQVGTSQSSSGVGTTQRIRVGPIHRELDTLTSIGQSAQGDGLGGAGTTETSVVRDASAAQENFFRTFSDGILRVPKVGGTRGSVRTTAPLGPSVRLPLFAWEGKPEDAELKIGRLYLDVLSTSGSVLYSDNVFLTESNTDGEAIAVLRLQAVVILQLSETMRLSAGGTLSYLPFRNEIGFADPLADYQVSLQPIFLTQFNYDIPFSKNGNVHLFDNFSIQSGGFGTGRAFDALDRDVRDLDDSEGRYSFRISQSQDTTRRTFTKGLTYLNNVGVSYDVLLPTVTRLTTSYTHDNIWYDRASLGQPSSADIINIQLASERENLRFKPTLTYSARHQNNRFGYDQSALLGLRGPLSPYMDVVAEGGMFWAGDSDDKSVLMRFAFAHEPRAGTQYQLQYLKTTAFPAAAFVTIISFQLRQILSPDLQFDALYQQQNLEPLSNPNNTFGSKEDRVEGRLSYRAGERVRLLWGYSWAHSVGRGAGPLRFDLHTTRLEIIYNHSTTLESSLLYQFERRESNRFLDSYDENVVSYTLTKKF